MYRDRHVYADSPREKSGISLNYGQRQRQPPDSDHDGNGERAALGLACSDPFYSLGYSGREPTIYRDGLLQ